MAFASTALYQMHQGSLLTGRGSLWSYYSSDASTAVTATGYFAACGVNSRGLVAVGMAVGDLVLCTESSNGVTPGRTTILGVSKSSANQASTIGSTGYTAAYDVTVVSST